MRAAINNSVLTDHKIEQRDIREEWTDPTAAPPVTFDQRLKMTFPTDPPIPTPPPRPPACAAPPIAYPYVGLEQVYWAFYPGDTGGRTPDAWRPEDKHAYFIHLVRTSKIRWELVAIITLCSDIRLLRSGRSWLGTARLSRLIGRERGAARIIHVGCKHLTLHNEHVEGHHPHFHSHPPCTAGSQTAPRACRWAAPAEAD